MGPLPAPTRSPLRRFCIHMFDRFLSARCPVDEQTRDWVAFRFQWLVETFGTEPLRMPATCPTADQFPERFDGSTAMLDPVMRRIAGRIGVDPTLVDLQVYEHEDEHCRLMRSSGLEGRWSSQGAAGYYVEHEGRSDARYNIAIERSVAMDPTGAVATLAHELCHALLLGGRHLLGDEEDGEPLTDLATVYFGFGIFTANSVVRESSWQSAAMSGWSIGRQGYLTFPILGLALAIYARLRGEAKPAWSRYLRPDARAPFRQGARYLRRHGGP